MNRCMRRRPALTERRALPLWTLPVLLVAGCRYGYEFLSIDGGGPHSSPSGGTGGSAGSAGSGAIGIIGGEGGEVAQPMAGRGTGGSSGSSGGGGGTSGSAGGTSDAGGAGAPDPGTGGSAAGAAGDDSAGGSTQGGSSGAATGGSSGTTAGGSGGGGSAPDLRDGYWVLDAADSSGKNWTTSTLVFTSSTPNPDGTAALGYRLDWFENAGAFGILLSGEEVGVGTFDPLTNRVSLDQTGGWAPDPLDHYEAAYDPATRVLDGAWNTGNAGTFAGVHQLGGQLQSLVQAVASSMRSGLAASNAIDTDMTTYWSSANGRTLGETLTLTLASPARLRGIRILSVTGASDSGPSRLTVRSLDGTGAELDSTDLVVSTDPMWKPMSLVVDSPVTTVELEIVEILPSGGNRVVVSGVELFGLP
ncbi:MAG TPA: hypothetical protein VGK73_13760 [Polyangiaceae bacterium]